MILHAPNDQKISLGLKIPAMTLPGHRGQEFHRTRGQVDVVDPDISVEEHLAGDDITNQAMSLRVTKALTQHSYNDPPLQPSLLRC